MSFDDPTGNAIGPPGVPPARGFIDIWKRAITRPALDNYQDLLRDRNLSLGRAMGWLFLVNIVTLWLSAMAQALLPNLYGANVEGNLTELNLMLTLLCSPILAGLAVLFWLILTGGTHLIVRYFLGGTGEFEQLAFAYAAYQAPMQLIAGITGLIPLVNLCLAIPYLIYSVTLGVIALNAVHNVGWVNAIAGYLAVPLLLFAGVVCLFLSVIALGVVAAGGV